jgi:hypothetical protein
MNAGSRVQGSGSRWRALALSRARNQTDRTDPTDPTDRTFPLPVSAPLPAVAPSPLMLPSPPSPPTRHCEERRERQRPKRRSNLKCGITSTLQPPPTPPSLRGAGARVEFDRAPQVAGMRPAPHSCALRKRRGNPEDLPPTTLPRVIPPLCHSERSEESSSSAGPGLYSTSSNPPCHSERSEESLLRYAALLFRDSSLRSE